MIVETANIGTVHTGHKDIVHDTAVDYYGQHLASASSDGTIRLFSVPKASSTESPAGAAGAAGASDTSVPLAVLTHHTAPVSSVSWTHPTLGRHLVSAGHDGRLVVWSFNAGSWVASSVEQLSSPIASFSLTESGVILVGTVNNGVQLWKLVGSGVQKLPFDASALHTITPVLTTAAYETADNVIYLAAGMLNGTVSVWLLDTKTSSLQAVPLMYSNETVSPVRAVSIGSDLLAPSVSLAVGLENGAVFVFRVPEDPARGFSAPFFTTKVEEPLVSLSFGPTGTVLAAGYGTMQSTLLTPFAEQTL